MISRPFLLLAAVLAAPSATAAPAGPRGLDLPVDAVVANPDWDLRPSAQDLSRHYPPLATMLELSGRATISCTVNSAGRLHSCSIVAESPAGFEFGRAALNIASFFRMKPKTIDGQVVEGATVRVPIAFTMGETDRPATAEPVTDLQRLAAARRIARAIRNMNSTADFGRRMSAEPRRVLGDTTGLDPQTAKVRTLALDAWEAVAPDAVAAFDEAMVQAYARIFALDELLQLAAFYESAAGRMWSSKGDEIARANYQANLIMMQAARKAARDRLCAKVTCQAAPAPTAP